MKKGSKKATGEKKMQIVIGFGKKDFDDTELRDSLSKLDNNLNDIDTGLKNLGAKLEK